MQLLNESNSDSGLSDQSDYNMSKDSSSTENETKTDVVLIQLFVACKNLDKCSKFFRYCEPVSQKTSW